MPLSGEERRALGVILGLLLLASAARWLERPRELLTDVPALDLAALEEASRAARPEPRTRSGTGPAGRGPAQQPPQRVDVNTASASELQRLPGIGPAVAARIIEERDNGAFTSLADLQRRVRGIGAALAARLEPAVTLPATHTSPDAAGPAGAREPPVRPAAPASEIVAIDLNRATAAELEKISGVGPILAARLVARRDSLGGFRDWVQVDAVPGVGPAMLARLKGLAVLGH